MTCNGLWGYGVGKGCYSYKMILILLVPLVGWAQKPDPQILIDEVRSSFAPDKRVAIFNIEWDERSQSVVGETNLPESMAALTDSLTKYEYPFTDKVKLLQSTPGLVNVSVCNIRSEPRHSAELSTQSLMGTYLRIFKEDNGWHYVQTPDGYLGWLDAGGFVSLTDSQLQQWRDREKVVVTVSFASIENQNGDIVSDAVAGNILRTTGMDGDYAEVVLPDGREGRIANSDIESYEQFIGIEKPVTSSVIKTARNLMGRPYLWGGTSVHAMDCSGFTKTIFYLNGMELPRDASQQVHIGTDISTDTTLRNLQPGDLLFFGRKASAELPEKITHVALYLGDGLIIHASERVRIQSLRRGQPDFAEHRLLTFVRAKRLLDNIGEEGLTRLDQHKDY